MRHRLMILGMLTLLLCACDPGHVFNYYLCPIEFKDGSRIQYCRDDSLPKSIYKSYSDYNCHQKRNSYHTTIYYYVTEEDHQQALKYGSR
ncbi:MAG: hypothetical protein J6S82_03860 [Bacteroidales bacterium]|nr:hypothetical protein [Bacteroidales bacterium]